MRVPVLEVELGVMDKNQTINFRRFVLFANLELKLAFCGSLMIEHGLV